MSELTNIFSNIANSIRNVTGSSDLIYPNNMANVINNISIVNTDIPTFFNYPVNADNLFRNCTTFNYPVNFSIPQYNLNYTFSGCTNFNKMVNIPYDAWNIVSMESTFEYCTKFNQPVTIPRNVSMMFYTFYSCFMFNQRLVIPNTISYLRGTLYYAERFNSSVYILGNTSKSIDVRQFLGGMNNEYRKSIYFNSVLNNSFNKTNSNDSMVEKIITWTDMSDGNGFYNEAYNIYCYTNFSGRAEDVPPLN